MDPADFDFDLPSELIAQEPLAERSASRLLHLAASGPVDRCFADLADLLRDGDLLVVNESRVVPARLHGHKASGGRIEMLLERVLGEREALVQLRASHPPPDGSLLAFEGGIDAAVTGRRGQFFILRFAEPVLPALERAGHVPLPPYIRRADRDEDRQRYQTVYARAPGSVAAPTAGLHFDEPMLERLAARGVDRAAVQLHVGAGTFAPLRPEQISAGELHEEFAAVPAATVAAVRAARQRGGRVVAVGTTTVRALETAAAGGSLAACDGATRLFIRPGYRFRVIDALITNFHLPRSSLLMLVAAFAGRERVLAAYRHAVAGRYRFFSYGDAMFVEPPAAP
ncbi:MAG: tRNA preQ1(34) S-adenosylmethionine ribosyltransferase-isomerase QueA [Gammaproteobacteria bacterium]|nr:tRNA preQ1(34) S-adenosylmethionine ribosyltransferase-isomerase QueA [Gammaproteobacteria bacterium]